MILVRVWLMWESVGIELPQGEACAPMKAVKLHIFGSSLYIINIFLLQIVYFAM